MEFILDNTPNQGTDASRILKILEHIVGGHLCPPRKLLPNLAMVITWANSLLSTALWERHRHLPMDRTQRKTCPYAPTSSQQSTTWTSEALTERASAIHTKHIAMDDEYCFPLSLDHSILPLMITNLCDPSNGHVFEQRHAAWQKRNTVLNLPASVALSNSQHCAQPRLRNALPLEVPLGLSTWQPRSRCANRRDYSRCVVSRIYQSPHRRTLQPSQDPTPL
jgi:hypothetical protein